MDETLSQISRTRDACARLMAMEGISVVHDPSAQTATFDCSTRVLTLPVWKDCPSEVYDMLVAHEVGHALYTPEGVKRLMDAIKFIDPRRPQLSKMLLNICEDARIERFIKNKYPGVGRSFAKGYEWMMNKDFFAIKGKSLSTLNLADRVNLYYKPGLYGHVQIPFNAAEQTVLNQIGTANTFDHMIAAAKALYDLMQKQQEEQEQQQQFENQQQSGGGDGQPGAEQSQDGGPSGQSDNGDGDKSEQNDQQGKQQGSANGNKNGSSKPDFGAGTQQSMEDAMKKMVDCDAMPISMMEIPEQDISKIVYPFKSICADIEKFEKVYLKECAAAGNFIDPIRSRGGMIPAARLTEFTRENRSAILTMTRRFEMKMNADVARRTSESRSGTLNMSRIHSYKLIEDIFLSNTEVAAGKNHGVVFYLDWSSSMNGTLHKTVKQLLNMTEFCRTLGIPFDVYAFTTQPVGCSGSKWDDEALNKMYPGLSKNPNGMPLGSGFGLLHFLSSSMNKRQYQQVAAFLLEFSAFQSGLLDNVSTYRAPYYDALSKAVGHFMLDGTPLDAAVVSAFKIVPAFKAKHNLQVVTCCILTDGEAHYDVLNRKSNYSRKTGQYVNGKAILTHNGKRYATNDGKLKNGQSVESWCFLMEVLKNAYGVNTMGIFLAPGAAARLTRVVEGYYESAFGSSWKSQPAVVAKYDASVAMLKSEDFCVVPRPGFDTFLVISAAGDIVNATDALDKVDAGDARAAGNAFRKGMSKRLVSRNLLTVIADTCSTCVGI